MRVVALANNRVGLDGVRVLRELGAEIAGVVVHPPERAKHRPEILEIAALPPEAILEGPDLATEEGRGRLAALRPDLGVSVFFGYILKPETLALFPRGVVNVHPAYLPFNRGAHPNVWSIVEGTPAGATLHIIDAGVDTGPIIARRRVEVLPHDTGETLYRRLEETCVQLLRAELPAVLAGTARAEPQTGEGTFHRVRDLERIDEIHLDRVLPAGELIDLLRARTFSPHAGAFFRGPDGRKIHLRLELIPGEVPEGGPS
jgi:methionyl-tRNA formyltransferase